eukprot:3213697-Heterocapsa_arctica.AAC.1
MSWLRDACSWGEDQRLECHVLRPDVQRMCEPFFACLVADGCFMVDKAPSLVGAYNGGFLESSGYGEYASCADGAEEDVSRE